MPSKASEALKFSETCRRPLARACTTASDMEYVDCLRRLLPVVGEGWDNYLRLAWLSDFGQRIQTFKMHK